MADTDLAYDTEVTFDGNWREFARIALPNLLLTLATLGLYRFWATARVRRYLWSRTVFMGDRLEWSGTGAELFRGALGALVVVLVPIAIANFGIRQLMVHGHRVIGGTLSVIELLLFYGLVGAAVFRGLRYRLSRTHWRGIRGGTDDPGLRFGLAYGWKTALGMASAGLAMPWAMASLWNQRWRAMGFGTWRFAAAGRARGLALPFLWCYVAPVVAVGAVVLLVASGMTLTWFGIEPRTPLEWVLIRLPAAFAVVFLFALIVMAYYASFIRQMVGSTTLEGVEFAFNASAIEWMELYLGDIVLVIATLGLGWVFVGYRHWRFYIRHFQVLAPLDPATLAQSRSRAPSQGEGLLDALDMGAL